MLTWLLIIMILNSLILSVIAAGAVFMTYDTILENRKNKKRLQAQKECDESLYWLELLKETKYIDEKDFNVIYTKALEVLKIIKSIIISTKKNLKS